MPSRFLGPIAVQLQSYRRANGFSQEHVALEIGCAMATYRTLEYPGAEPDRVPDPKVSTILRVLAVLDLETPVLEALARNPQRAPSSDRRSPRT